MKKNLFFIIILALLAVLSFGHVGSTNVEKSKITDEQKKTAITCFWEEVLSTSIIGKCNYIV